MAVGGSSAAAIGGQVPQPRIALIENGLQRAVGLFLIDGVFVDLAVDHEFHIHTALDRSGQRRQHRRVGEFIEAAADRISTARGSDKLQHRLVEVAAQPL